MDITFMFAILLATFLVIVNPARDIQRIFLVWQVVRIQTKLDAAAALGLDETVCSCWREQRNSIIQKLRRLDAPRIIEVNPLKWLSRVNVLYWSKRIRVRSILRKVYGSKYERIIETTLSDIEFEWNEAKQNGKNWTAIAIRINGAIHLMNVVVRHAISTIWSSITSS